MIAFALDLALTVLAVPLVFASAYLFFLALVARKPEAVPESATFPAFDIIVPAHNEEVGIAHTVQNLRALAYPPDRFRVLVVADNCTDQTAERARAAGALVLERFDLEKQGKGYALTHAFDQCAIGSMDAVVVVDADTEVSSNLLTAFSAHLAKGEQACQAEYGVLNPHASWRTRLMTIAFALFHNLRSLARKRMGVSCGLRGNGMCFTRELIQKIPHDAFSLVEDLEYGIRLGRAGYRVHYVGEAWVKGEMVTDGKAAESQRRRWEGGRWGMMRLHGWPLFREALRERSILLLDLSLDLLVPPLSSIVAAAVLGVSLGAGLSWIGAPGLLFCTSLICLLCATTYVLRGWALSGARPAVLLALAYAPFYVTWKLVVLLARARHKRGEWVRTRREGESSR